MDNQRLRTLAGLYEAKWSGDVKEKKEAPEGLFAEGTKAAIVKWLKANHKDLKSAMASLNFYINRAGKNLDASRKAELELAKETLRKAFGVNEDMDLFRKIAGLPAIVREEDDEELETPPEENGEGREDDELPSIVTKIAAKVEGKTGDELADLINKVYDAGFADGKAAGDEGEKEEDQEE